MAKKPKPIRIEGSRLPLGRQRYTVRINPGWTVAEIVHEVADDEPVVVTVDGIPVERSDWGRIRPRPGALLTIAPEAGVGFVITALVATALSVAASLLLPRPGTPDSPERIPRIEGGSNDIAAWQPLPMVFGQLRYAPPAANDWIPYDAAASSAVRNRSGRIPAQFPSGSVVAGANVWTPVSAANDMKQWIRTLLCWGHGTIDVTDIKLGATPLADYGDGVSIVTETGTTNSDFPHATRLVKIGADLNGATTVKRFLGKAESSVVVNLVWPQGLYRANNKGEIHGFDEPMGSKPERRPVLLTIKIFESDGTTEIASRDISAVGGTTETPFHQSETFTIPSSQDVILTVERRTAARDSLQVQDDLQVHSAVVPLTDAPINGFDVTTSSVRIQATDQISGTIPVISGVGIAHHPDWDSDTSAWVTRATRNPASAFREVLLGVGNARPLLESEILMSRLQDWHEWCEDEGFTYDAVHSRQASVDSILEEIAIAGRARPAWIGDHRAVIIDRAQANRVNVFTPSNSRRLQASRAGEPVPHALRCRFRDRDRDYAVAEVRVYRPGFTDANATLIEERRLPGITRRDTISAMLAYQLRSALNRRERYQINVDWEHLTATVGDRVALLHDAVDPEAHTGRALDVVVQTTPFVLRTPFGLDVNYVSESGASTAKLVFATNQYSSNRVSDLSFADPAVLTVNIGLAGRPAFNNITPREIADIINDHLAHAAEARLVFFGGRVSPAPDVVFDVQNLDGREYTLTRLTTSGVQILVRVEFSIDVDSGNTYTAVVRRGESVASYPAELLEHYDGLFLRLTGTDGRPDVEVGDLIAVHQSGTGIEDCFLEAVEPVADEGARLSMIQYGGVSVFSATTGYTVVYVDPEGEISDVPFGAFELARRPAAQLTVERIAFQATVSDSRPSRPAGEDISAPWQSTEPTGQFVWVSRQMLTVYPLIADPAPATYEIVPTVHVPVGSEVDAGVWSEAEPWGGATVMGDVDGFGIEEAFALFPSTVLASDGTLTIPMAQQPLNTWGYDILRQEDSVDGSGPQTLDGIVWTDGPSYPTAPLPVQVKALRRIVGSPEHGTAPVDGWGDWAWYVSQLYASSVNYREISIYQKVGLAAAAPAAPTTPTWVQSSETVGGLGSWSQTFPTYDPNTERVACAILLVGDDNSASVVGAVRFCENPGDINAVFIRSATNPDRLADSATRLPDNTYDTDQDVPAGAGPIWIAVGNRAPNATTWTWSAWDKIEGTDGKFAARELDVYRVINAPASGGSAPATPTATRYSFETDGLFGLTANWVRTRPLSIAQGQLVYCCTVSVQDDGMGQDTDMAFSAPVVCNDVLDIDIIYGRFSNSPPKPGNTSHDTIPDTWYARPGLIPEDNTGELWECVRYLRVSGDNIRWEYDDPYRVGGGDTPPYFLQPVIEIPIRAFGDSITDAPRFDPNPAEASLSLRVGGATVEVGVSSVIAADGVTPTLSGDNADDFELVT